MKQNIVKILPTIADKTVIELINSINVSKDHHLVQNTREGLLPRMLDNLTGKGAKRQHAINENLISGLDAAFKEIESIIKGQTIGFRAIESANQKIDDLNQSVSQLIDFSMDTRQKLEALTEVVRENFIQQQQEIKFLNLKVDAGNHVNLVCGKLRAKNWSMFAPASQLFIVLDDLYWGDFGMFYDNSPLEAIKLLESLKIEAIAVFKKQLGENPAYEEWFEQKDLSSEVKEGLQFLGDWAYDFSSPFTYHSTHPIEIGCMPLPPLMLPEYLVTSTIKERFKEAV